VDVTEPPHDQSRLWTSVSSSLLRAPPAAGGADIFCMGPPDLDRLLTQAVALASMGDEGGLYAKEVLVILPPQEDGETEPDEIVDGLAPVYAELVGRPTSLENRERLASRVRIVRTDNLQLQTLLASFPQDHGRHVVVVAAAARYRDPTIALAPALRQQEDIWSAHLTQTALRCVEICRARGHFTVLDAGEFPPTRPENLTLIESVQFCGVYTGTPENMPPNPLSQNLERWGVLIDEGRVGAVLREIDAEALTEPAKVRLKIQVMSRAGLHAPAMEMLRAALAQSDEVDPEVALAYAVAANAARASDLVSPLLTPATPFLNGLDQLESALRLADADLRPPGTTVSKLARPARPQSRQRAADARLPRHDPAPYRC
jgi:hypothetical protein